MPLFGSVILDK